MRPVEDGGGDDRRACLDFIRRQAEGFSNALDVGEDLNASWMVGMSSDVGTWYNIDVDNFLERAQACTRLVSISFGGDGDSSEDEDADNQSECESERPPGRTSWNGIRGFFNAGQSYE